MTTATTHDPLVWEAAPVPDDHGWRRPDVLDQILTAADGGADQRFRCDYRNIGIARGWGISLVHDLANPGVTLIVRFVTVLVHGRWKTIRSLRVVSSLEGHGALIDSWHAYFNVFHRDYRLVIPRVPVRPESPTEAAYWTMEPCWETFTVPHRVARRLADRAAEILQDEARPGWDAAVLAEALAWASITPDADILDDHGGEHAVLIHPDRVRQRLALRTGLTPAQAAAAAWQLDGLAHGTAYDEFPGHFARDPCRMAHPVRLRLLDHWIASGRRWQELVTFSPGNSGDPSQGATGEPVWLAHDLTYEQAAPWRDILERLGLNDTQDRVAGLLSLRESGITPVVAGCWANALGERLYHDYRFWQLLVEPLAVLGADPLDAASWARRRARSSLEHISAGLTGRAAAGWMSPEVRHIPWPVRDRYRALADAAGIGPGDASRLYRLLHDDPGGHDRSLATLKALNTPL